MTTEHMPKDGGKSVVRATENIEEGQAVTSDGKAITNPAEAPETVAPKITKATEELPVELNDVEWNNRAREMAQASRAVEEAITRKKSITSQASSDVKSAEAKRDKLVDIVSTRTEMREVTVETVYDYEAGTVTRKRTDNNEVLSTRDMIDAERQGRLIDADDFIATARDEERKADEAADADADAVADDEIDDDDMDDELDD